MKRFAWFKTITHTKKSNKNFEIYIYTKIINREKK